MQICITQWSVREANGSQRGSACRYRQPEISVSEKIITNLTSVSRTNWITYTGPEPVSVSLGIYAGCANVSEVTVLVFRSNLYSTPVSSFHPCFACNTAPCKIVVVIIFLILR